MKQSFITSVLVVGTCVMCPTYAVDIDIHGFASQSYFISGGNEYLVPDSSSGSFELNEVGINFGADVTDDIRVGLQLYSRDMGDFGNNRVNLDWAFVDYSWRSELGFRFGRIKMASGFWREFQDYDFTRAWAFLPTGMYNPQFRDLTVAANGANAYGYYDTDSFGAFSYQATLGAGNLDDSTDLDNLLQGLVLPQLADAGFGGSITQTQKAKMDYIVNAQLTWEAPIEGLRVNGTYFATGPMDFDMLVSLDSNLPVPGLESVNTVLSDIDYNTYGWYVIGVDYTWDDLYLVAEYGLNQQKFDSTVYFKTLIGDIAPAGTTSTNQFSETMYLGGSYRVNDQWQFGAYYEFFFEDRDDRLGKKTYDDEEWRAYRYDLALSARYDVNDNWLFKAEFHTVQGAAGASAIPDEDLEENWWYATIKTTVNF